MELGFAPDMREQLLPGQHCRLPHDRSRAAPFLAVHTPLYDPANMIVIYATWLAARKRWIVSGARQLGACLVI